MNSIVSVLIGRTAEYNYITLNVNIVDAGKATKLQAECNSKQRTAEQLCLFFYTK